MVPFGAKVVCRHLFSLNQDEDYPPDSTRIDFATKKYLPEDDKMPTHIESITIDRESHNACISSEERDK